MITEGEFKEWLEMEATRDFKKALFNSREMIKEGLASKAYENPEEAIGMAKAIVNILTLDYEGLRDALKGDS